MKLNVGDYARVVNPYCSWEQSKGAIIRICNIYEGNNFPYMVEYVYVKVKNHIATIFSDEELEQISEDEAFLYMI